MENQDSKLVKIAETCEKGVLTYLNLTGKAIVYLANTLIGKPYDEFEKEKRDSKKLKYLRVK